MSSKPLAKKRRRASKPEQSASVVSAGADISALVAALVPAVTKGVVDTLTSMGVIPQGKEQPEASQGSSTCTQNTSDILTLTDNDQGEDLQTLVDLQGKEPSNPRISRPLGPGIDNKVKAKIRVNEAIDFGSILGFKKGRKKFEINEELDVP